MLLEASLFYPLAHGSQSVCNLLLRLSMRFSFKAAVAIAPLVGLAASQSAAPNATNPFGPSAFTVPGAFPTSVYGHYFNNPTGTSAQVQPVITDPVSVSTITSKP